MQLSRLTHIKIALTERPDNNPLSSANSGSYNSKANPGIPSALADFTSQSGTEERMEINSKVRFAPVMETAAVGAIRAHTL
jgi:hypothetical protein